MTAGQYKCDVTMLSPNDSGVRYMPPPLVIVHTNQGPASGSVAGLLGYLQRRDVEASYTIVVGGDGTTGRSNDDEYAPWAAGSPANERGLHLCFLGYAEESRAAWLARPAQLDAGADIAADWCRRYGIPARWLTADAMRAGAKGIGGHDTTVAAWHATDHTDPGAGFPRDVFVDKIIHRLNGGKDDDDMALTPEQDRMLREVWEQLRGPGGKGWPQLGHNDKGQNLTPVDKLAALGTGLDDVRDRLEDLEADARGGKL